MRGKPPKVDVELRLAHEHGVIAAIDEVGRGALAGPVTVGVVLVDAASLAVRPPRGLRDSKLLSPAERSGLRQRINGWVLESAVACASAEEIDAVGIISALRRAGERALSNLSIVPSLVLLDGSHNWLSRRDVEPVLFDQPRPGQRPDPHADHDHVIPAGPQVMTKVKADMTCASVSAASVLAKLHRDELMSALHEAHPQYSWCDNKGYAAPAHRRGLVEYGLTEWHRHSWNLHSDDADLEPSTALS